MLDCVVNDYSKCLAICPFDTEPVLCRWQLQAGQREVSAFCACYCIGTSRKLLVFPHFLLSCVARISTYFTQEPRRWTWTAGGSWTAEQAGPTVVHNTSCRSSPPPFGYVNILVLSANRSARWIPRRPVQTRDLWFLRHNQFHKILLNTFIVSPCIFVHLVFITNLCTHIYY